MKREEKVETVNALKTEFSKAKAAYITGFIGLKVMEIDDLRKKVRGAGGRYHVLKNTFARLSTMGTQFEKIAADLSGPVGWAITSNDPIPLAKVLRDFAKDKEIFAYHGGMLEGRALDKASIERLADMPPKEVLVAQLLGLISSPARNLASVIQAVPRQLVNVIEAIRKKKEEESKNV